MRDERPSALEDAMVDYLGKDKSNEQKLRNKITIRCSNKLDCYNKTKCTGMDEYLNPYDRSDDSDLRGSDDKKRIEELSIKFMSIVVFVVGVFVLFRLFG